MRKRFIPFPIRISVVWLLHGPMILLVAMIAAAEAFIAAIVDGFSRLSLITVMAIADQKRFKSESRK
jgi:hypothetical protein